MITPKLYIFNKKYLYKSCFSTLTTKKRRVVITGLGAISPLGNNSTSSWEALLNCHCGIKKIPYLSNLPCSIAASIPEKDTLKNLLSKDIKSHYSEATHFALLASIEALSQSNLLKIISNIKKRTGVFIGNGLSSLSEISQNYEKLKNNYRRINPYFIIKILHNMSSSVVSKYFKLEGPVDCVSSACATGSQNIGNAFRLIQNNIVDVMICGGSESPLDELTVAGFVQCKALNINANNNPQSSSRPFSNKSEGFILGEGAAILVLEELEHAKDRNANIIAEIIGYSSLSDPYHITQPDPTAIPIIAVMQTALDDGDLKPNDIDLISAHATSTKVGDITEKRAISKLFSNRTSPLYISATKSSTGHLLGAAGALGAVFTVNSIRYNTIAPTLNIDNVELAPNCFLTSKPKNHIINNAILNSFGFGGVNSCLLFKKYSN